MIDTATVAHALSRTLGGEWICDDKYLTCWASQVVDGKFVRSLPDPRESTDVCLEMLRAEGRTLLSMPDGWSVNAMSYTIPTSGQPFRDAVIRLCAGEE